MRMAGRRPVRCAAEPRPSLPSLPSFSCVPITPTSSREETFDEGDVCEVLDSMCPVSPTVREPTRVSAEEVKDAISEAIDMCLTTSQPNECAAYWDAAEEVFYAYMRQNDRDRFGALNRSERESREYDM